MVSVSVDTVVSLEMVVRLRFLLSLLLSRFEVDQVILNISLLSNHQDLFYFSLRYILG